MFHWQEAECCVEPDQTKYRTKSSNSWSLLHKAPFTRYQIKLILTISSLLANKWISYLTISSMKGPVFFFLDIDFKQVYSWKTVLGDMIAFIKIFLKHLREKCSQKNGNAYPLYVIALRLNGKRNHHPLCNI